MLNISSPLALWLGLSILPILFFYFLRMRFRQQPISSIYLWSRLRNVVSGDSRLRRRRILLLLLQLLTALAAVEAVAQPVWTTRYPSKPGVIYLLDVSASMGARDVNQGAKYETRLGQAKSMIINEINKQPRQTEGIIFLCSAGIKALCSPTTSHRKLKNALIESDINGTTLLQNASFMQDAGFMESEVADQLQTWLLTHKKAWRAVLVTDGGLDLAGERLAKLFGGNLKTSMVGASGNNIGVTALRILSEGKARFLIRNGWPENQSVKVNLKHNDRTIASANLNVPPGASTQMLSFAGPISSGVYQIELAQPSGNLYSDDRYYLAVNKERSIRVLWVGYNTLNPFIRAAFNSHGITLSEIPTFPTSGVDYDEWDLVIADQASVPRGLRCNLLAFNTAPPDAPVQFGEQMDGLLANVYSANPLQRFVDWSQVRISTGYALKTTSDVQTLATVNEKPIIATWEKDGRHYVIFGTDLFHSDLGLSGAFPVFMQNLIQQCVPQWNNQLAYTLTVGETAKLAEPATWRIINTNKVAFNRRGPLLFVKAFTPGVFNWGQGVNHGILVANPPSGELDTTPRVLHFDTRAAAPAGGFTSSQIFFGNWGLGLLLICLCCEWLIWRGLPAKKE